MSEDGDTESPKLHELTPTENAGRSTIGRYQAQFRAAAYECLSILSGNSIDRVYCDYHDDYVSRETVDGQTIYHFYQVKTKSKRNYRWSKREVFGLYSRKPQEPESIRNSFGGKLLVHTVRFNKSCGNVVLLTNVHFEDSIEEVITSLDKDEFENSEIQFLIQNFNEAFVDGTPLDESSIHLNLKKFGIKPGFSIVDPNDSTLSAMARQAIYRYSEVELEFVECEEIIHSLVNLVEEKSFATEINELDQSAFDDAVGIGISDLLDILSISKGAYDQLSQGGDPKAIKSASIIQRKLQEANASDEVIEYCSKAKVDWDNWYRSKRHSVPEFELAFLDGRLRDIQRDWQQAKVSFADLESVIDSLWSEIDTKKIAKTLSRELLLGGVLSALVRSESQ